ncbi:MAG: hypothetical protein KC619_04370, partial [Myxococcales bacterium]|nr:hypothetical protein [Myxococcales bacterium]
MRRPFLVALIALWLSGCGPAPRPTPTPPVEVDAGVEPGPDLSGVPGRAPTAREHEAMRRLMRVAESIRSLRFETDVPFRVQDRPTITQFVRDQIDAEDLERARVFYVAVGLLPPDLAVDELIVRVLGEQIVGYYDPDRGLMVVREDVATELGGSGRGQRQLGEAEMVLVHELVHALQD